MFEIWPSLISADLLNLQTVLEKLDPHCQGYHIDIMDNHFVPNLTWGAQFANAIAGHTKKSMWVHLMIDKPELFIDHLELQRDSYITFHVEMQTDINALIHKIHAQGWRASIAISPKTPVEVVFPFLDRVQQILIMSVNPGQSGQELIPSTLEKILPLQHMLQINGRNDIPIALDGGINRNNIVQIQRAGISQCAVASGIFSHDNPVQELTYLYALIAGSSGE